MANKPSSNARIPGSLRCPVRTTGLLSASLVALSGPALAQQQAPAADQQVARTTLSTIVVEDNIAAGANPYADPEAPYKVDRLSSSKFTEPLINVSKSVDVIPEEVIEDSGAQTLKEVMRTQPGVTIGTGEGGNAFGDRFIIRGFEARNDVFVDGLRDPGVVSRETFAVEQIEILKGPGSTYNGRGTTGGAINIVGKLPQGKTHREIQLTAGTDDTKRFTVDMNEVINERFVVRFNGLLHDGGVAGRDEVEEERQGLALAALYSPIDQVELMFDYYHLNTDSLPDWGVPYDVANNEPFDVDRNNFYGIVDRDYWETKADILTAGVRVYFNDWLNLESRLRYGTTGNEYVVSAPERPDVEAGTVNASAKTRDQQNDYWAHQTNLIADFDQGSMAHTVVAGFELTREDIEKVNISVDPRAVIQDIYNPNPNQPWTGTITKPGGSSRIEVDTRAIYLMDTVRLSDQWQIMGGVRYDQFKAESFQTPNPNADGSAADGGYATEEALYENDVDFFNWHAGVVYKPTTFSSIYAAYSSSSNPSGEQLDAGGGDYGGLTGDNADLDPERNKSYEIGTKWNLFDDNLLLSFAVFQIDKENARTTVGGGRTGLPAVTTLSGEQRVRGAELSFSGNVTPRLSLYGGVTVLDTEILEAVNEEDEGKTLPNVADTTFSLMTKYQATDKLAVGGQLYYSSEINGGTVAALDTELPSYWRLDLLGEYRISRNLSVQANVLNATDEVYYDALYRSAAPFIYIAPGRSASLTLTYDF